MIDKYKDSEKIKLPFSMMPQAKQAKLLEQYKDIEAAEKLLTSMMMNLYTKDFLINYYSNKIVLE